METETDITLNVYNEFLNRLDLKWKEFLSVSIKGQKYKKWALEARKISLELRDDLKDFRKISIVNDIKE